MPHGSTKPGWPAGVFTSVLALVLQLAGATPSSSQTASTSPPGASCPGDNGGITLPKGFCATILADGIGHARQLVVAPDGTVYVNCEFFQSPDLALGAIPSVPSESDDLRESHLASRRQFTAMSATRYRKRFDSISYGSGMTCVVLAPSHNGSAERSGLRSAPPRRMGEHHDPRTEDHPRQGLGVSDFDLWIFGYIFLGHERDAHAPACMDAKQPPELFEGQLLFIDREHPVRVKEANHHGGLQLNVNS